MAGRSGATVVRLRAGGGQAAHAAGLDLGQRLRQVGEHHLDLARRHVAQRLRARLVGHALDLHAGQLIEHLARQALRGAGLGVVELAGILLGVVDQLGDRLDRQVVVHHQRVDAGDAAHDRREVLLGIVGELLEQRAVGGVGRVGAHQQRVAVGRRGRDGRGAELAAGARACRRR